MDAAFGIQLASYIPHHDGGILLGMEFSEHFAGRVHDVFLSGLPRVANDSEFRYRLFVDGEFMVTFLLVFAGLEPAANSDSDFSSMACFAMVLDMFLGRSLSSFRSIRVLSIRQDISVQLS